MKRNILTNLGKQTRKLRIDNEELLMDMANKLEISASYLSSIETGKRKVPKEFIQKIESIYKVEISEE